MAGLASLTDSSGTIFSVRLKKEVTPQTPLKPGGANRSGVKHRVYSAIHSHDENA